MFDKFPPLILVANSLAFNGAARKMADRFCANFARAF
jgi:hypothetical protein